MTYLHAVRFYILLYAHINFLFVQNVMIQQFRPRVIKDESAVLKSLILKKSKKSLESDIVM